MRTPSARRRPTMLWLALLAAAVTVATLLIPAGSASADTVSFDAGTVTRNGTLHTWWNRAKSDACAVGLVGIRTDNGGPCHLTAERTWYARQASGEKEFHIVIRGDRSYDCSVQVHLGRQAATGTFAMSSVSPGSTRNLTWDESDLDHNVYLVGVVPEQPSAGACELEVRTTYRRRPTGSQALVLRVTNVGSVTCAGHLTVVPLPIAHSSTNGPFYPGEGMVVTSRSDTAESNLVVPGVDPASTSSGNCDWMNSPSRFGAARRVDIVATNTGSTACLATVTWALL